MTRINRVLVSLLVACTVAAVVGVVVTGHPSRTPAGSGEPGRIGASSSPPPSTSEPTTTVPPLTAIGTYEVASTTLAVVDPTVPEGSAPRQVPTTLWYPSNGTTAPDRMNEPYPLIVFSQGFAVSVSAYTTLLTDWASAGFVVAAPTYPDTAPTAPTLDRGDLPNHPADLRAVIGTVVAAGLGTGTALSGLINAQEIGLVGHSDGGDVSLAVAADTCCRYSGIQALVTLSGAEYDGFGTGQYFGAPTPPLLVVQGNADTINPPVCSAQIYDAAPEPKYYLDLLGASHLAPYTTDDPWQTTVAEVTTDFLEAELAGRPTGLGAMTSSGNVSGIATLTDGPTAPLATGSCPTAP
ncbi:MAG: hypothetical protein M0Z95_15435 [Actinomycetota bacterium]|jgi:alpha-beta hydrolase superfamily lysophospholipase|nr:hypothetical protein [Actinomycetota bacterium]